VAAVDPAVPWRLRDVALLLAVGAGGLVVILLAALGVYRLEGAPDTIPAQPPPALVAVAADLFYLIILAGVWLLVVRRYGTSWAALGCRLPDRKELVSALALLVLVAAGCAFCVTATMAVLAASGVKATFAPLSTVSVPADPLFVVGLVGAVVLAPVAEELLFRGILYQALRKHVGVALGIASSAVIFAGLHVRPVAAPALLMLGIGLAAAFERTRSLYPSMAMHAAYNGVIILLAWRVI
jgi:membrane protease YdiL (CAAX protease family)